MATANIQSPDVIRRFREQFVKFDDECRQALTSVNGDVGRVSDWLRREQLAHWKRELQRRDEKMQQARLDYLRATQSDKYQGKNSGVDELKILERMKRMKQEAEKKIENVKRWSWALDQKAGKLIQPCSTFHSLLEYMTPQALARLDRMLDNLDDYMRITGAPPADGGKS
ncbi:MAG: hypothetical protein HY291_08365 [Planctomycetes bacterium]|nr:hypothetical protein [Planctomycetota bacterium]